VEGGGGRDCGSDGRVVYIHVDLVLNLGLVFGRFLLIWTGVLDIGAS
jgi:hypothetical protein